MKRAIAPLAFLLVVGCGKLGPLQPAPGEPLPVKPRTAARTPTPEELLTMPPYAAPERVDELLRRSEPRRSDRFDLPPPDGGAAPTPDVEPPRSTDEAGPATPQ